MDINSQFKPITEQDLYDFYGIASLRIDDLSEDAKKMVEFFLITIRKTYMEALFTRFAHWSPNGGKPLTIDDMIKSLRHVINDEAAKQASRMALDGTGFNMMAAVKAMRGEDKPQKAKEILEAETTKKFADNLSKFDKDKYPLIAKSVIAIHEAKTLEQIILAIDRMNDLSHWGGSVLCDFIAGHRDPSDPEGNRVFQEIMEIKKKAPCPLEFANKMSPDIRKIIFDVYGKHQV